MRARAREKLRSIDLRCSQQQGRDDRSEIAMDGRRCQIWWFVAVVVAVEDFLRRGFGGCGRFLAPVSGGRDVNSAGRGKVNTPPQLRRKPPKID
jgi:hypothetical protein